MRKKFIIVFLLASSLAISQKRASEAGIISDNDLYTSSVYDKYYTNGLELFYRYLNKNENEKVSKKITEFRFGQYIYNPQTRNADEILRNDRPFAGYLFIEAGRNVFYQDESVLKANFQLGYVGPNGLGREMQMAFHDVFGYKKVNGWQHQIENALGIQTNFLYSKKLLPSKPARRLDMHFQSEANVGTIWNSLSSGILSRIGLKQLLPVYKSNLHGASVNTDSKAYRDESEFYFYFEPRLTYQFYDATVQ
jgi:lipid A 3-O-deacylase